MARRKTYSLLILCSIVAAGYGCGTKEPVSPAQPTASVPKHRFVQKGSVTEMTIVPEDVALPEAPGKNEFQSYCGICHSLKYITAQPRFPRATWEAEVHKMVEKYGAPVDTNVSKVIVDYLMVLNGK
ncbi:MAG: hypothetical protein IAE95_12670 [Chitinophagaceae bacterium]|nr:hypothetical protein [Chitinophagaceae bacterium]